MKTEIKLTLLTEAVPFEEWKFEIEQALLSNDLLDAVTEENNNNEEILLQDDKELRKKKAKAFGLIMSALNEKDKAIFRSTKCVNKRWKLLNEMYQKANNMKLLHLEKEIIEYSIKDINKDINSSFTDNNMSGTEMSRSEVNTRVSSDIAYHHKVILFQYMTCAISN